MSHNMIKCLQQNDIRRSEEEIRKMKGLPECIGAIGGTYIKIKGPLICPEKCINRKGYHSVVVFRTLVIKTVYTCLSRK